MVTEHADALGEAEHRHPACSPPPRMRAQNPGRARSSATHTARPRRDTGGDQDCHRASCHPRHYSAGCLVKMATWSGERSESRSCTTCMNHASYSVRVSFGLTSLISGRLLTMLNAAGRLTSSFSCMLSAWLECAARPQPLGCVAAPHNPGYSITSIHPYGRMAVRIEKRDVAAELDICTLRQASRIPTSVNSPVQVLCVPLVAHEVSSSAIGSR